MCVIAARHFGLAYELWAKDPIEDPYREGEEAKPAPKGAKTKQSVMRLRRRNLSLSLRLIR